MQVNIRITSVNSKWANFQYLSSNSKSRILTKTLKQELENGTINVVNKEMINGYMENKD